MSGKAISRRQMLRASGVALALPYLEAMTPAFARTAPAKRRMVAINLGLGLHLPHLVPAAAGRDYALTPYLEELQVYREHFTVISGTSHPGVDGGHLAEKSFLTTMPHPNSASFRNSISLDQFAAERWHGQTRFASLALSCEGFTLSWTRTGAMVPSDSFPSTVFARLFIDGRPDEVEAQKRRLADGRSILDSVGEQATSVQSSLGARDRAKLDEYFTSVRELEQRLAQAEAWSKKPKPKVDARPPQDVTNPTDLVAKTRVWFDLIHLALQTDSTRLVTLQLLGTSGVPPVPGVSFGHHDLSHHGKDPAKIEQLKKVEIEQMKTVRAFLTKLKDVEEAHGTLLDRTMVFFSSNLADASTHAVRNMPVLLAGGGFRHGQHLAFDAKKNPPLCNLYVSMLQRLGIESDKFGSSTGTLTGLDVS